MHRHSSTSLTGYQTVDGDYGQYLTEFAAIAANLATIVRPNSRIVLDPWNFWHGGLFTARPGAVEQALAEPPAHCSLLFSNYHMSLERQLVDDLIANGVSGGERPVVRAGTYRWWPTTMGPRRCAILWFTTRELTRGRRRMPFQPRPLPS